MIFVKKIPPTDIELSASLIADGWKKIKEPSSLFIAILFSIPFMAVNSIATYFVIKDFYDPIKTFMNSQSFSFQFNFGALAIFFLLLVIHEFLHALFIPNFINSNQTYWGLNINGGFVSTTQKLTKIKFIIISIVPFVFISIILPLILGLLGLMNGFIFFLVIFNAMASSVDMLNLILILFQVPNKSFIINNGFETYYS